MNSPSIPNTNLGKEWTHKKRKKKSEEIAVQTTQTKEQPVPAQPSYAELKKEKAKAEAELNKGFPGNRSVGKLFWGYLVCGSLFWALMFYGVGMAFTYRENPNFDAAGLALLICAVILYLWGSVFSVLSFMAGCAIKGKSLLNALYFGVLLISSCCSPVIGFRARCDGHLNGRSNFY